MNVIKDYIVRNLDTVRQDFNLKKIGFNELQEMGIDDRDEFSFEVIKSIAVDKLCIDSNFIVFVNNDNVNEVYVYIPDCKQNELDKYSEVLSQLAYLLGKNKIRNFRFINDNYYFEGFYKFNVYEVNYNNEKSKANLDDDFIDLVNLYAVTPEEGRIIRLEKDKFKDNLCIIYLLNKDKFKYFNFKDVFNAVGIDDFIFFEDFPEYTWNEYKYLNLSGLQKISGNIEEVECLIYLKNKFLRSDSIHHDAELGYIFWEDDVPGYGKSRIILYSRSIRLDPAKIKQKFPYINIEFYDYWCEEFDIMHRRVIVYNDYLMGKKKKAVNDLYLSLKSLIEIWQIILKKSGNEDRSSYHDHNGLQSILKPIFRHLGCNVSLKNNKAFVEYYEDSESNIKKLEVILDILGIEIDKKNSSKIIRKNILDKIRGLQDIVEVNIDYLKYFIKSDIERLYIETLKKLYNHNDISGDIYISYRKEEKYNYSEITIYYSGDITENVNGLFVLEDLLKYKDTRIKLDTLENLKPDIELDENLLWFFKIEIDDSKSNKSYRYELEDNFYKNPDMYFINKINEVNKYWRVYYDGQKAIVKIDCNSNENYKEEIIGNLFNLYNIKQIELN